MVKYVLRLWYACVGRFSLWRKSPRMLMNLGYAKEGIAAPKDNPEYHQEALYAQLVEGVTLDNRSLLEIGCGRGGGIQHLHATSSPKKVVAMDRSGMNIKIARKHISGIDFRKADACDFNFQERYDVILNLESSHAYACKKDFFENVTRHLKRGGLFCYADLIQSSNIQELEQHLRALSFEEVSTEDITPHVLRSINLNAHRWFPFSMKYPRLVPKVVHNINVTPHSRVFESLSSGELVYKRYVLRLTNR